MRLSPLIFSFCLGLVLVVTLSGCGNSDPEPTTTSGFTLGESRLGIDPLGQFQITHGNNNDRVVEDTESTASEVSAEEVP